MKSSYTYTDLVNLDKAVYDMHKAFDSVPEYKGYWVPKFHFASHTAMDILRFGPVRSNWCFMYEAKNQPMKRGCKRSNFHNPPKATAEFWAESSDYQVRKRVKRRRIVEPGPVKQQGEHNDLPELSDELEFLQSQAGLGESTTYHVLRSAWKNGVYFFPNTFALIHTSNGGTTLCRIQHLVMAEGHTYVFVDVYPDHVLHYDNNGVMQTMRTELDSQLTRVEMHTLGAVELTAMWHFTNGDTISFLAKW